MSLYIPKAIKRIIITRADYRCEYCRVPDYFSNFDYHIDHIIGLQHGGPTIPDNLAYSCSSCNWKKDLISVQFLSLAVN